MIEIGRFTTEKWGVRQCNKYLKQLDDAFHLLARPPEIGKSADDVKSGYRKFSQGSHVIFYREGPDAKIVVVRILPNSMDVERHI